MFPPELVRRAEALLEDMRARNLRLATAESCTGGLITALLTEIPGSSDVVERGFVTYSNAAKTEALGVDAALIETHGAVSAEVARAMAAGALGHSNADLAVAVTGIAGPDGGTAQKPVGLVYLAIARSGGETRHIEKQFGAAGRSAIRLAAVESALSLVAEAVQQSH